MTIDNETIGVLVTAATTILGWVGKNMLARIKEVLIVALKTGHSELKSQIEQLSNRVEKIEPIAEKVYGILTPNGGTSLADRITQIQRQMSLVNARLAVDWATNDAATYECDEHGECINASPQLAKLFETTQERMLGRGWLSHIRGQAEREKAWDEWAEAIERGIPYDALYTIETTHGPKQIRTYTVAVKDTKGVTIGYLGCASEVKE